MPVEVAGGHQHHQAGRLAGHESRSIGGYSYRFPLVEADVVYLWPARPRNLVTRPAPWPWWGYW